MKQLFEGFKFTMSSKGSPSKVPGISRSSLRRFCREGFLGGDFDCCISFIEASPLTLQHFNSVVSSACCIFSLPFLIRHQLKTVELSEQSSSDTNITKLRKQRYFDCRLSLHCNNHFSSLFACQPVVTLISILQPSRVPWKSDRTNISKKEICFGELWIFQSHCRSPIYPVYKPVGLD